jgi:hypothetical protein
MKYLSLLFVLSSLQAQAMDIPDINLKLIEGVVTSAECNSLYLSPSISVIVKRANPGNASRYSTTKYPTTKFKCLQAEDALAEVSAIPARCVVVKISAFVDVNDDTKLVRVESMSIGALGPSCI